MNMATYTLNSEGRIQGDPKDHGARYRQFTDLLERSYRVMLDTAFLPSNIRRMFHSLWTDDTTNTLRRQAMPVDAAPHFTRGDTVRYHGGPDMDITNINADGTVTCVWQEGVTVHTGDFATDGLELIVGMPR
jgi:uncharacterized protein YodC (DUF2158 family)